jgi:hypothetical protein
MVEEHMRSAGVLSDDIVKKAKKLSGKVAEQLSLEKYVRLKL